MDQVIVGGIASRIASKVLKGRTADLQVLTVPLLEYVLTFYGRTQPSPNSARVVALDAEPHVADLIDARRKRTG